VPAISSGYLAVSRKKDDIHLVRFIPFDGKPVTLGSVASTCTPRENFVSSNVFVIESCGPKSPDLYLDAWSINGKNLWRGRRDGHNVLPVYASARNGSRFAVATLLTNHYTNLVDSLNREDVKEQAVQVMDTQTGQVLMTIDASPIISAGQNFALSPDGSHLAVLRNGAIEIYAIPAPSGPNPK
jgi:hypothetical protein